MHSRRPVAEELEPRFLLSTLYVDDTPGQFQQFSTVQAAVNAAGPGDIIYVKEGVYRETVTLSKVASAANPIILQAYPGDEGKVLISGATAITGWRRATGPGEVQGNPNWQNIYIADVGFEVKQLFQNGIALDPSRYGNVGTYRFPTSTISSSAFYDSGLPGGDGYWTGGIVHIKNCYWRIDDHKISGYSSSSHRIDLASSNSYGISTQYGYFITNVVGEIKAGGQWAYRDGKVYMMSTSGSPQNVEASSRSQAIRVDSGAAYNEIRGLEIAYVNDTAVYVNNAHHITVVGNSIHDAFLYGVQTTQYGSSNQIVGNDIRHCGYAGVRLRSPSSNVEGNYIYGMGTDELGGDVLSGIGGVGIFIIDAEDSRIYNNRIDRTGYNGIEVTNWSTAARGLNISYNHISNCMLAVDDGGGIYLGLLPATNAKWNVIDHNIVENSWGFFEGTPRRGRAREGSSQANGIYLDDAPGLTNQIRVTNNTVISAYFANLFLHDTADNEVLNNTFYNGRYAQAFITDWRARSHDNHLQGNILFSTNASQAIYHLTNRTSSLLSDYNQYQTAVGNPFMKFQTSSGTTIYSLAQWRGISGQDAHSGTLAPVGDNGTQILTNPTLQTVVVNLGAGAHYDIYGNSVGSSVTLAPFGSIILLGQGQDVPTPVADDLDTFTDEDTPLTDAVTGSVDGGGTLTFSVVATAGHGTVSMNANGTFTYTPAADWFGTDSFTFRATSGGVNSAPATVTVEVDPVNDAPTTANRHFWSRDGQDVLGSLQASDPEGDSLTFQLVDGPADGALTLNPDGSFTYTPDAGWSGQDSFTFVADDGQDESNTATVTITAAGEFDMIWLEAEDATTQTPWQVYADANCSGGSYLATPDAGVFDTTVPAAKVAQIQFTTSQDGSFVVWARTNAPSGTADSLWVSVDGGDWLLWDVPQVLWGWHQASDRDLGLAEFDLSAGTHTLSFKPREDGAAMDRILITNDDVYVPSGIDGAGNNAPVADNLAANGTEDTPLNDAVAASDPDDDDLTFSLVGGPAHGSVVLNADGSFTYTPQANYNGADSFTFRANDGVADSNTAAVTLNVAAVNDIPTVDGLTLDTLENAPVEGTVTGDDVDGDALSFAVVGQPEHGSVQMNPDGSFTYTPDAGWSGQDSFTFRASDGQVNSSTGVVTIAVDETNSAPVANNRSLAATEDTPAGAAVTGSDGDGDALTFAVVTGPAHGSVVMNADGTFTYTPQANYNGTDSFTFRANDGQANSPLATVTVNVAAVNDVPVAGDRNYRLQAGGSASGTLQASDIEDSPLTFHVVTGPTGGSLTLNADGTFTYTPGAGWTGSDSFTFRANDGQADSNIATVTITASVSDMIWLEAEDATFQTPWQVYADAGASGGSYIATPEAGVLDTTVPVGKNCQLQFTTSQDGTFVIWVRTNAPGGTADSMWASVDGGDWMLWDVPQGLWGWHRLSDRSLGAAELNLSAGTHTLSLRPREDGLAIDCVLVTNDLVYVPGGIDGGGNDAPVADDSDVNTRQNTPVSNTAAAIDANGDPLGFYLVTGPAHGAVVLNLDGTFTYTPQAGFSGADGFTFKANDGNADSNTATVAITVGASNTPPVANNLSLTGPRETAISDAVTADDDDGDALTCSLVTAPAHGSVTMNADGTFTYTPQNGYTGQDSFTFKANDGQADSNTATVTITLVRPNSAPRASDLAISAVEDRSVVATAAATDDDGDAVTFRVVRPPTHGSVVLNAQGTFTYTPELDYSGADSFTYCASDGIADSASAQVAIDIAPVNDAPVVNDLVVAAIATPGSTAVTDSLAAVDPEGDAITYYLIKSPRYGKVAFNADGTFTYSQNRNWRIRDSFTYAATDGQNRSRVATVTVAMAGEEVPLEPGADVMFRDADGQILRVSLRGDGHGVVKFAEDGDADVNEIVLYDTTDRTSLYVAAVSYGARTTVGNITVDGSLGQLTGWVANFHGDITVSGSLGYLRLGNVVGGHIQIGQDPDGHDDVTMRFNSVADLSIDSDTPIRYIRAYEWLDGDGAPDQIEAPSLGRLWVTGSRSAGAAGDFQADLKLTGSPDVGGRTLDSARVAGSIDGATWDILGNVGSIRVYGQVSNWTLHGSGDGLASVHTLRLGQAGENVNITVVGRIRYLRTTDWAGGNISAGAIHYLYVTGDSRGGLAGNFGANLTLTGEWDSRYTLHTARVAGDLGATTWNVDGDVRYLSVSGTVDQWQLHVDNGDVKDIRLDNVLDADILLQGALKTLKAQQWLAGRLEADSADSIRITGSRRAGLAGDFGADILLTGQDVDDGDYTLGELKVDNRITGSRIQVMGDVSYIRADALADAQVLVGCSNATGSADDFTQHARLRYFRAKGLIDDATGELVTFDRSTVAAWEIGKLRFPSQPSGPSGTIQYHGLDGLYNVPDNGGLNLNQCQ